MTKLISHFAAAILLSFAVLAIAGPKFVGGRVLAQSGTPPDVQSTVEYCVRCAVPQTTSICSVVVESSVVSVSEWQAFCASQVALDGGYGQCSATPGVQACQADQVFSYRSTPDQGIIATNGAPGDRQGGYLDGAADYVRQAGEDAGQVLGDGVSAVGQGVRDGAEVVSETASDVGSRVTSGARRVGDAVTYGLGCVFTLGRKC